MTTTTTSPSTVHSFVSSVGSVKVFDFHTESFIALVRASDNTAQIDEGVTHIATRILTDARLPVTVENVHTVEVAFVKHVAVMSALNADVLEPAC